MAVRGDRAPYLAPYARERQMEGQGTVLAAACSWTRAPSMEGLAAATGGVMLAAFLYLSVSFGLMYLVMRPWDGRVHRDHRYTTSAPFAVFWVVSWLGAAAEALAALKPAPMRIAQLASAYTQSQVIFALVNLRIPDLLAEAGRPQTAPQLATALAAQGKTVPLPWLERLLVAAAAMGMLKRCKAKGWLSCLRRTSAPEDDSPVATIVVKGAAAAGGKAAAGIAAPPLPPPPANGAGPAYTLNAVSAALTSASPVCMSSFVKLLEDDYGALGCLSQGLESGEVPFSIWSKGQRFWQHLAANERHAKTFDQAMQQKRHIGGMGLVHGYRWGRYDAIVDVAGGVGQFTADVLQAYPRLRGVVVDQPQQIARAKKIWGSYPSSLSSRVALRTGDLLDAASLPPPPAGAARVAYVLYDILHNWDDASAVKILAALRDAAVRPAEGAVAGSRRPDVTLLLLETTRCEEVLPCHLPFRCGSDLAMLALFGEGKERNRAQFSTLLASAGWTLTSVLPTRGIFVALEAVPTP